MRKINLDKTDKKRTIAIIIFSALFASALVIGLIKAEKARSSTSTIETPYFPDKVKKAKFRNVGTQI